MVEGKMLHHLFLGRLARRPKKYVAKPIGFLGALQGAQGKLVQQFFLQLGHTFGVLIGGSLYCLRPFL